MTIFNVPDMSCGHCKTAIEKAIAAADPSATIVFDMDRRRIDVASTLPISDLTGLLEKEGYPASVAP